MKDIHGDTITVLANDDSMCNPFVEMWVSEDDRQVLHEYSPRKARKLAAQLTAAAEEVEKIADFNEAVTSALVAVSSGSEFVKAAFISHGVEYQDGDVVLFEDINAVLKFDATAGAWFSAGPESHNCSGEFQYGSPILIARDGRPVFSNVAA